MTDLDRATQHNPAAEQALIGAALLDPTVAERVNIQAADFYQTAAETTWHTLTTINGAPDRAAAILQHWQTTGQLKPGHTDGPWLHDCAAACITTAAADQYADIVRRDANIRHAHTALTRALQRLNSTDPAQALLDSIDELDDGYRALGRQPARTTDVRNIDTFLDTTDPPHDWLIPGLLERHDRLILTGPEGGGKSTFCRQVAIMAAAGIHPFTGEKERPIRVLYLDLENSEGQSRRKLRPLRHQAADQLNPDQLHIDIRSAGIDLLTTEDQNWLHQIVDATNPDLFITGPLYRMAAGDPTEETTAKPVSQALDRIRNSGCGVIIEAHAPHAGGGQKRPRRPYGASLWLRWPEFGMWLDEDGTIEHWRVGRDEREWPAKLRRGGDWPWTPDTDPDALMWSRIRQARVDFGLSMTVRDVAEALGGTASKSTVGRVLQRHRDEWDTLNSDTT
jgi:hypothetical protein